MHPTQGPVLAGAIAVASGFSIMWWTPRRMAPSLVQIGYYPQYFALSIVHLELSGSEKLAELKASCVFLEQILISSMRFLEVYIDIFYSTNYLPMRLFD